MNAVLHALAPYQDAAHALVTYFVTALWMGAAIAAQAGLPAGSTVPELGTAAAA